MVLTRSQARNTVRSTYKKAAEYSRKPKEAPVKSMGKKDAVPRTPRTPMNMAKKSAPPNAPRHQATEQYRAPNVHSKYTYRTARNPIQLEVNARAPTATKGAALTTSQKPKKSTAKKAAASAKPRSSQKSQRNDSEQRPVQSNAGEPNIPPTTGGIHAVEVRVLSHSAAPVNIPLPVFYNDIIERDFPVGDDFIKISIKRVPCVTRLRSRISSIGKSLDSAVVHRDVERLRSSARDHYNDESHQLRRSPRTPVPRTAHRFTSTYR